MQPIFNALLAIYALIPGGDFGVALIILTVIIRMLLYPLVKRQLHQTRMMRKLQPELKRIKKEAAGDKQAEAARMMELYKKHGVSPFRSVGILVLQLPIFIGLYSVVRIFTQHHNEFSHYTYKFLEHLGPIHHLIQYPDQLNLKLFGLFDLSKSASSGDLFLVVLALVAAATQYVMSKQTLPTTGGDGEKKGLGAILRAAGDGKQADQADINAAVMGNMTKIMPFFMFFLMIGLPGALALYYAVSNLVAVAQQSYLLRQDEQELEEIADEPAKTSKTSGGSAKQREKKAEKAHITRIVAGEGKKRRK